MFPTLCTFAHICECRTFSNTNRRFPLSSFLVSSSSIYITSKCHAYVLEQFHSNNHPISYHFVAGIILYDVACELSVHYLLCARRTYTHNRNAISFLKCSSFTIQATVSLVIQYNSYSFIFSFMLRFHRLLHVCFFYRILTIRRIMKLTFEMYLGAFVVMNTLANKTHLRNTISKASDVRISMVAGVSDEKKQSESIRVAYICKCFLI